MPRGTRRAHREPPRAREPREGLGGGARSACEERLASNSPSLRAEARAALAALDPATGLALVTRLPADATELEWQRAYRTLGTLEHPDADGALLRALEQLAAGELEPGVQLDVLDAARRRASESLAAWLAEWEASLPASDPVARHSWAIAGGDASLGERVFQGKGDCQRCHGRKLGGHGGGGVGPDLTGLAGRTDRAGILRSVVDPQAEIAPGFARVSLTLRDGRIASGTLIQEGDDSVVLEIGGERVEVARSEIASQTQPTSAMPQSYRGLSRASCAT